MTSIMTLPNYMTGFLHELGPSSGVYSYVSYPSAILPTHRPKYRNEAATNIMHDRRVVRGNTYAQRVPLRTVVTATTEASERHHLDSERLSYLRKRPPSNLDGRLKLTSSYGSRSVDLNKPTSASPTQIIPDTRHLAARARARKRISGFSSNRSEIGISAIDGRKHCLIQTEKWLEEIKDRLPDADVAIQTDRESWPPLVLPKEFEQPFGIDKSTQILPDDPDLFVFDDEVVVVLEMLVGKTLEQGLIEVIDEEEIAAITKQKISSQQRKMMLQCT